VESDIPKELYQQELDRLQTELVYMTEWIKQEGVRMVVVFEGVDAAGKGGVIKRITEYVSPRVVRTVALPVPSDRERTQWYFQRYIERFPAGGEAVLFDRSWYNRAGVEWVMGFCTAEEHRRFLQQCPIIEHQLIDDGIILRKYWLSISPEEQERRFRRRLEDPKRRWKLSPIDLEARSRWVQYAKARDEMFVHCDTPESPWWVVEADDKRRARINCVAHILDSIRWEKRPWPPVKLGKRPPAGDYQQPPRERYRYVPDVAGKLIGGV
jgi:polyphosphate kinase 2